VKNFSVSVYETDKEVIFMKKIVKGWASKSYGLDVAKLAWIPATIVEQAKIHLWNLEVPKVISSVHHEVENLPLTTEVLDPKYEKVTTLLDTYDLNNITPLQALQLLSKIKDDLK
jgi:DNA mismatch repair protein MutS